MTDQKFNIWRALARISTAYFLCTLLPWVIADGIAALALCAVFLYVNGDGHVGLVLQTLFGVGILQIISLRLLRLLGQNLGTGEVLVRAEPVWATMGPWARRFGMRAFIVSMPAGELTSVAWRLQTAEVRAAFVEECTRIGLTVAPVATAAVTKKPASFDIENPEA